VRQLLHPQEPNVTSMDTGPSEAMSSAESGSRSAADLSSLLVELSRLIKAMSFYPVESAQRKALLDRTFLAWQADLSRSGALTLVADSGRFASPDVDGSVEFGRVYNIASALLGRRIEQLEFSPQLGREAFGGLARLLAGEAELVRGDTRDPREWTLENEGIAIVRSQQAHEDTASADTPAPATSQSTESSETARSAPPTNRSEGAQASASATESNHSARLAALPRQADTHPNDASRRADGTNPPGNPRSAPRPDAAPGETRSATSPDSHTTGAPQSEPARETASTHTQTNDSSSPADPQSHLPSAPAPQSDAAAAPSQEGEPEDPQPPQQLEEAPPVTGEAATPERPPAPDRRASELASALEVLEECDGDDDYTALSDQIARTAADLARDGHTDDAYHAALALADHAVGDGGRSGVQARQAQDMLVRLSTDALLPDLIARSGSQLAGERVRAAQLLLQLGKHAAAALFDGLLRERDPERSAQLAGVLIALGERAQTEIERQIQRPPHGPQPRLAIRLAGEMQDPALVPTLAGLFSAPDGPLRKEAAQALVTIGGRAASDALVVALSSPDDELVELAAEGLGEMADRRAVPGLLRELDRTASNGRLDCALKIAQALGRIGAEEAVPRLAAMLELRGLTQRRKRRELKLAAVDALGQLRSKSAHVALTRASRMAEIRVRERAQAVLARPTERPANA
jgi:hypothetical protein